ncbi:UbiD family decarboxylase [Chloroflexota bacterium]
MGKDLRHFLKLAKAAGPDYYVETAKPISPKYEISVISQKLCSQGRFPVLYCPQIEGSQLPVVGGLWGSYELQGLALDMTPEELREAGKGRVLEEYRKRRPNVRGVKDVPSQDAPVQEVVLKGSDIDLGLIPFIHHYELNPTKYATIGITILRDPDTGVYNAGVYRQEVKGKDRIACMATPVHHGFAIGSRYAELGKKIEVVTIYGHHPVVAMAATGPHQREKSELETMGALLDEPLEVTKGVTVDLPVPAFAEIAIEGIIDPTKMEIDGPFSETFGYYGEQKRCYVVQVTAITMRKDAIYNNLDPRHPEHNMVSQLPRESNLLDRIKSVVPTVSAVHYGPDGVAGQNFMYISLKKRNPGDGRLAGLVAVSTDRARKFAVAVDEDIDVYNEQEVLWAIGNRVRGELDITILPRMPSLKLHPSAREEAFTKGVTDTKVVIDATEPDGFATRVTPPPKLWASMKLSDYLK